MFSLTNNCDSTKTDQLQTIRTIYHIVYTTNTHTHRHTERKEERKRERERNTLAISIVPKETDNFIDPPRHTHLLLNKILSM